ncbi:MAG TPA: hypothetical protein EYP43_00860, partial [Thermoplasmata archaeon]|nr:hypothetical protein [Thermoplasmata archaeon]
MNGKGEKGLIAVALAFLLVISAMSIMQMIPGGEDVEKGGEALQHFTDTRAYQRMLASNLEPENVEEELDPDGDGDPEIDNGILDEAGSVDPEEILDEDGDGEPDYATIAEPGTPLGEVANSSEGMDILEYEVEDVEEILDEHGESVEGDLLADEDAEEIVDYDPEDDAGTWDEEVVDPDDVEGYRVLVEKVTVDEAVADPASVEGDNSLTYEDLIEGLADYDETIDEVGEEVDEDGRASLEIYWTYDFEDSDGDGIPEHEWALLLVNWTYDIDRDGNPELRWSFLAGYESYDNDSDNVTEYEAVLIVRTLTVDLDDDGTPERVREWDWGRVRRDTDEDGHYEDRLIFVENRLLTGEENRTLDVKKWGWRRVDADGDGIEEEDSAVFVHRYVISVSDEPMFRRSVVWMRQEIDLDDDRRIDT